MPRWEMSWGAHLEHPLIRASLLSVIFYPTFYIRMIPLRRATKTIRRGFTVIELMVALTVTGILAGMLLKISNDVLDTYNQTTGELDSQLAARFVLDQLAEDLQAAVSRRDGRVWLAATVRRDVNLTGKWVPGNSMNKPIESSLRLDEEALEDCRFGVGGVWLRLITQSPDALSSMAGARAISYAIDRRGTQSPENESSDGAAAKRYTLFRGDVSPKNSFLAGFNLHPVDGDYTNAGGADTRDAGEIKSPDMENGFVDNVIDLGVRFYVKDPDFINGLRLVFPSDSEGGLANDDYEHLATTDPDARNDGDPYSTIYPEVADVMVRVLTMQGAEAIRAFEEGDSPRPSEYSSDGEYWWFLAEQQSHVFVRRIQLYPSGV